MNTVFPRLPMLHSIGRSSGFDLEEPPEDCHAEDDDKSRPPRTCNNESANILLNKFESTVTILDPGGYLCNKFSSKLKSTSLMHCWKGAEVIKQVYKIKQMMILKSKLEFQKDVVTCLESATKLEELIKKSFLLELDMWDDICHNRIRCPIRTNLIELSDLCDDLRVQMNFWSSIWKRLFCNSQLGIFYGEIAGVMMKVRIHFNRINSRCLSWLSRLILVGFRVLAHCDLDRIEYESLCNIAKGLEEYNLLVDNFKLCIKRFDDDIPQDISSMRLSDLLKLLAHERSKYSAISCKEYLFGCSDFLKEVQNYDFNDHMWVDGLKLSSLQHGEKDKEASELKEVHPIQEMLMRISEALSSSYPPLMDFIRRERGFIESFLHAVCHVTTLLSFEKQQRRRGSFGHSSQYVTPANHVLMFMANPLDTPVTTGSVGNKSSKKKVVTWSDSLMTSQANYVASKYFAEVWQFFVGNFIAFLEGFYWMGSLISSDHLGCLVLSNDVVSHLVSHVLGLTAQKGLFPAVLHPHLLELSLRYLFFPSLNAWKTGLFQNISSSLPLLDLKSDNQLDWFQDIPKSLSLFKIMFEGFNGYLEYCGQTSVHKAPLMFSDSSLHLYYPVMTCFMFTCSESLGLCHKNILKSLSQSDLQSFLTYSRSHLKVLSHHLEEASHISMRVLSSTETFLEESSVSISGTRCVLLKHLKSISEEVNILIDKLKDLSNMASMSFKELCSHKAIQFFKNDMPTGKIWKRKDDPNQQQKQHNDYIEKGVDTLLKPVIMTSSHLDTSERLQVLSIVIHELCMAWMNNILEKKIKFSYHGACQLERDMLYVRSTIQIPKMSSKLLSMDIFDYLRNVVGLLKQQPNKGMPNLSNNSASDASSKSNSSKSGSKSNSIESSPLTLKVVDPQSPQPTTIGASNGALQSRRPSKKSRSSTRSITSKEEKSEKPSRPNQDGRPKFGRSAKVSTNSADAPEVQNNYAFTKEEEKSPLNLNDFKDVIADSFAPQDMPSINCSGTASSPTGNGLHSTCKEANLSLKNVQKSIKSNDAKSSSAAEEGIVPDSNVREMTKIISIDVKCEELELSDNEGKDSSPLRMLCNQTIARKEEWLALRVRRGTRSWPRLPLCFSGSIDSCGS